MSQKLLELGKAWDDAAKELAEARQKYHKAADEKQVATNKHRTAKANYIAERDRTLGVEPEEK